MAYFCFGKWLNRLQRGGYAEQPNDYLRGVEIGFGSGLCVAEMKKII
ncbi:MAG: hypothetical protein ACFBSF_06275 [Leptolyngbyaceae cyanobacterium]